jgi:hypothetical protein
LADERQRLSTTAGSVSTAYVGGTVSGVVVVEGGVVVVVDEDGAGFPERENDHSAGVSDVTPGPVTDVMV